MIFELYSEKSGLSYFGESVNDLQSIINKMCATYKKWRDGDITIPWRPYFEILIKDDVKIKQVNEKRESLIPIEKTDHRNIKFDGSSKAKRIRNLLNYENQIAARQMKYDMVVGSKEKDLKKTKEWRENNKEMLSMLISCECGGKYKYSNKARHINSKRHQSSSSESTYE